MKWRHIIIGTGSIKTNASLFRGVNLARELSRKGIESHIILRRTSDTEDYIRNDSLSVIWVNSRFESPKLSKSIVPTIFHAINPTLLGLLVYYKNRSVGDILLSDWDEYPSRTSIAIRRRFEFLILEFLHVRCAGLFVFSSQYLHALMTTRLGAPSAYIPYGFRQTETISTVDETKLNSAKWIVYVGSFAPNYRIDIMEVIPLARCASRKGLKLLIIGEGPVLAEIRSHLIKDELEKETVFLGYKPAAQMEAYLRHRNVVACFLPLSNTIANLSRCPNKLFQYMAAQKPVICPRLGEPGEILQDAGCYYNSSDYASLDSALEKAIRSETNYPLETLTWGARTNELIKFIATSSYAEKSRAL